MDRLDTLQLNRATLARQLLLRRAARPARDAIAHLAGLQAQAPLAPYVGLWTRLSGFGHQDLTDLLTERIVVRAHLMRNTVHLVTAADFLSFRPLFQPLMRRALAGNFGRRLGGVDLAELRAAAAPLLAGRPLTRAQLAGQLAGRWPDHDPAALAYAATHLLPLVQVPTARNSTTCPTPPGPARTSRPRPGSCPSTTTCCCPSPTGAGSSGTPARSRCPPATAPPPAPCSSKASGLGSGRSPAAGTGPS